MFQRFWRICCFPFIITNKCTLCSIIFDFIKVCSSLIWPSSRSQELCRLFSVSIYSVFEEGLVFSLSRQQILQIFSKVGWVFLNSGTFFLL